VTRRDDGLAVAEQPYSRREAERWTGGTPVPLGRYSLRSSALFALRPWKCRGPNRLITGVSSYSEWDGRPARPAFGLAP